MNSHGILAYTAAFLAAAVVSVPFAKRLGLGSVLGYLIAGAAIGPYGFRIVTDSADILKVSEFGVVMLLFVIGLELNPKRLWDMRAKILGLGPLQVVLSALAVLALLVTWGWEWRPATVAGVGFAMSSTAIVLQILAERGVSGTPAGKDAFSVLLFQDLAVIPLLALLPLLGTTVATGGEASGAAFSPAMKALLAVGVVVALVVASRTVVRPLFRLIAQTRMREMFAATSLLIVVGIALLMEVIGLSMALGTFLAGVVLADSEYRHELESNIDPFKGLLLGLFFTSVGSSMDFSLLAQKPWLVLGGVVLLLVAKGGALLLCARVFKMKREDASLFSVVLSQGGEFAFVLFSAAILAGALTRAQGAELTLIVALSMTTTPFLLMFHDRVVCRASAPKPDADTIDDEHSPVIVAGLGRVGQIAVRLLHAHKVSTTVIDFSPELLDRVRSFGFKAYYGDASQLALLESAGIAHAKVLILAIDDRQAAVRAAQEVRKHYPNVKVIARAFDLIHVYDLRDVGVTDIERETFDSAVGLGERALVALGHHPYQARRAGRLYKRYDLALVERLYKIRVMNQEYISTSAAARAEMTRLFENDEVALSTGLEKGWDG
jgi:glutathione-regulated potassium-efflux system ancillary protein KefC